jgi:hypothetical protein
MAEFEIAMTFTIVAVSGNLDDMFAKQQADKMHRTSCE